MKLTTMIIGIAVASLHTGIVWAADYAVQRTLQLSASSTEIWNMFGDFCDFDDWHPEITDCTLKVIDGGLHRNLTMTDGSVISEKRIATEPGLSYTYSIVGSSLPIEKYIATFSVEPLNGTLISWSGRFSSNDPKMEAVIAEFYEVGLSAIKEEASR